MKQWIWLIFSIAGFSLRSKQEGIETSENCIKQKVESLICLPKASSRIWLEEKQCSKKIISMQKRSKTSFLVMKQKTFSFWSFYDWFTFWFLEVAKSQLLRVFASWRIFMVAFQSPCSNNLPYRKKSMWLVWSLFGWLLFNLRS